MLQDNQPHADSNHGLAQDETSSFSAPYRHKGYKKTLNALRDALHQDSAVILKGVEGTGKSTLVAEIISEYQHKGVPVVTFDKPLQKPAQLYAQLAESLSVPKQKKDLIRALRNTKEAGQYCLVVIDQEAINSEAEVAEALQQLCKTSETTAGAIKLLVVCKDYLVIHTEGTPQADFHDWIAQEIILEPLHTDDIEGYIYYLCALKGIQSTPYEVGTDFMMIEQTEGRISRLKALLLPLIHNDVITRHDIMQPERNMRPLDSKHSGLFAIGFALILAIGVGVNHFLSQPDTVPNQAEPKQESSSQPIFAEESSSTKPELAVTPPSLQPEKSTSPDLEKAAETETTLPILNPESTTASVDTPHDEVKASSQIQEAQLQEAKALKEQETVTNIGALPEAEFQTEVRQKLELLEQQLAEAIAENNRLKNRLTTATVTPSSSTAEASLESVQPDKFDLEVIAASGQGNSKQDNAEQLNADIAVTAQEESSLEQKGLAIASEEIAVTQKETAAEQPLSEAALATSSVQSSKAESKALSALDLAIQTTESWQQAWQNKDHEAYVAAYVEGFNGAYKTHQRWLKKRYDALNRPKWIKLERNDFFNTQESDKQVSVDFWLSYEASSGYRDRTLKRLIFVEENGSWLIKKEKNLQVKPGS